MEMKISYDNLCPLYNQACAVAHRTWWSMSVPAMCTEAVRAALRVPLHRHSHVFRDMSGRISESGRMGNGISQREEGLERGGELDIHVSVRVRGVDGPHRMLRPLALILNSCQSGSHPVRGLSHRDTLPRDLHHHQSQQGGGDAV